MKKLIIVILCFLCYSCVNNNQIKYAEIICEDHGGINYIQTNGFVKCSDGTTFTDVDALYKLTEKVSNKK